MSAAAAASAVRAPRRPVALAAGLLLVFAVHLHAQGVPTTITCADVRGRPVRAVQTTKGIIAKATVDADGRPAIEYDPRAIEGVNAQQQLFVYAHECGHHALGHDPAGPFTPAQEQEADCHGIQALMTRAGLTSYDVGILQSNMRELSAGAGRRLPWRPRMYDLEGCLPEVAAQRAAAARGREVDPNDCLVHNDAENAIIRASRDRVTVEGSYAVRNRCPRALNCTFTIELGALPDADAGAGSWRNFRVQKTFSEQHTLAAGAASEFRFRGAIDNVRDGESVDFRVISICR